MLEATAIIVGSVLGGAVLLVVLSDLLVRRSAHRDAAAEQYMATHPSAEPSLDATAQTSGGSSAGPS